MKTKFQKFIVLVLAVVFSISFTACQSKNNDVKSGDKINKFTVGVVGDVEREVWEDVKVNLKEKNVDLDIKVFSDYVQPNTALVDDSIDMNAFQHIAFLADFIKANDAKISAVGYTYISPMAAYSDSLKSLDDLETGAEILIPNDPTNGGRALLLLQQAGLIKVDEKASVTPTLNDIVENKKNLNIREIDAAQIFIGIKDVAAVVANTNFAVDANLDPFKDGIYVDTNNLSEVAAQYKNTMAVLTKNAENDIVKLVVEAYQSESTANKIKEVSKGADQKAWSENDKANADLESILNDLK